MNILYIGTNSIVPYQKDHKEESNQGLHCLRFGCITAVTLKCLSIGTPKIINFCFVSNGKFMVFTCPNIDAHYNEAVA